MPANRKLFFALSLLLIVWIVTLACSTRQSTPNPPQQGQAPQAQQNPEPQAPSANNEAEQAHEHEQEQAQEQQAQAPEQQPDPVADPEAELDEVGRCAANKEIVLVNSEVFADEARDEETGQLEYATCHYFTKLISQAREPVVILYQWNTFVEGLAADCNIYHWKTVGPLAAGGEHEFLQEMEFTAYFTDNVIEYERLFAYVAIYDRPECQQYINSFDIMSYSTSLFFECDQYIPEE